MKMYRTSRWDNKISEVDVTRTSDKSIWFIENSPWRKSKNEIRESKTSGYHRYHDSWRQAHKYLIVRSESKLSYAKNDVISREKTLSEVRSMVPNPEVK